MNTPFAPYHALALMGSLRPRPATSSSGPPPTTRWSARTPSRRANGDLAVLLVNKDPDNAHTVALELQRLDPGRRGARRSRRTSTAPTRVQSTTAGTATSQTLPPYSLTLLTLRPARTDAGRAARAGPPGGRRGHRPDRDDLLAGRHRRRRPIAKYEVYRQNGAVSEQLGETTGTSFTVRNLEPGRRYTVNVLARDTRGRRVVGLRSADVHHHQPGGRRAAR